MLAFIVSRLDGHCHFQPIGRNSHSPYQGSSIRECTTFELQLSARGDPHPSRKLCPEKSLASDVFSLFATIGPRKMSIGNRGGHLFAVSLISFILRIIEREKGARLLTVEV